MTFRETGAAIRPRAVYPLAAALLLATLGPISAQERTQERAQGAPERTQEQSPSERAQERLSLALATPAYPVTPGDTYRLSYLPATAARAGAVARVSEPVIVRGDYTVDLGAFGAFAGRGVRFEDLRSRTVALVDSAYPGSDPSLLLIAVGTFEVHLRGAVETADHAAAWGLSRLSEVLDGQLTEHASARDVRIERDGGVEVFDLFRAQRFGVRSHDPYLQPGDRICVSRRARSVAILGEVRRPGTYQLLDREGLADLVAFADGFTPRADLQRVRIDSLGEARAPGSAGGSAAAAAALVDCDGTPLPASSAYRADDRGTTRYAAWDLELAGAPLRDGDVVAVGSRDALRPAVFFEGAVGAEIERIIYRYRPGETLFDALSRIRASIVPGADLANATFARPGAPEEPIDLDLLLHGGSRAGDRELAPLDRIIIPARRFEVALRGEITRARQYTVSPLTRLNDVVPEVRTPYTSIRRIDVELANGQRRSYDLFRWRRFGELAHNPLLTPGATITFRAREREVRLAGEVRRPGTYQLLDGEELRDLIERYGEGLTAQADPSRVTITRQITGPGIAPRSIAVDFRSGGAAPLRDEDAVAVHRRPVPVVYVEGALSLPTPTTVTTTHTSGDVDQVQTATEKRLVTDAAATGTTRRAVAYHRGATAFDVLFPLIKNIRDDADLRAGYVLRGADRLPVDLERLLFAEARDGDLPLDPYDTIVIPVRRLAVTVAGAVRAPGVFPYLPGRNAGYYVRLAGGVAPDGDAAGVTVIDGLGRRKERSAPLAPDDQIFVPAADASVSRIIAPVATVGSLVLSIVSLVLVVTAP